MFHEFAHSVVQFISQHPHLSLFIVFAVAFIESLPILGTIFPGSITMTAIGTLLGSGVLPTGLTFAVAIAGAFIGDFLSYKIGIYYDGRIGNIWPFKTHPQWLTAGEEFFKKHGGKSIIIGRFIGPVRSTVPLIAGAMKVRLSVFLMAGLSSAILWSGLYILPGFLLGALSVELPPGKASEFLLVGASIIIGVWFIFWAFQRLVKLMAKHIHYYVKLLWQFLTAHPKTQYLINLISSKADPLDHTPLLRLLLAGVFFLLFLVVALNVAFNGLLTHFNLPLFNLLQSFHTHDLAVFFATITALGDAKVMLGTAIALSVYLLLIKRSRAGWYFLLAAFLSAGSVFVLKKFFHNPRPTGLTVIDSTFSFPSGHTILCSTILGFLAFTIAHQYKRMWYWIPYMLTAIVILLMGLSRLFLGAHWLTDVVGSCFLGIGILLVVIISYAHNQDENTSLGKGWTVISLIVLLGFWGLYAHKEIKTIVLDSTPLYPPQVELVTQEWWQDPEYYSPKYYLDRFGHPVAPFNVQWEGSLNDIQETLVKAGWQELRPRASLRAILQRLINKDPEHHTAILTPLYRNARPALAMFKRLPDTKTIIEFHLWQANVSFSNSKEPLWLGVVNFHIPSRKLLGSLYKNYYINYQGLDALDQLTPTVGDWQSRVIQVQSTQHSKPLDHLDWHGDVLLVRPNDAPVSSKVKAKS
ncbi:MAG TPA: phosphatase PAP2 family protein [Coxiellaceae bacterium]|nr:phosphatase PAP2 family protein [Coxiellaceae bacterium]